MAALKLPCNDYIIAVKTQLMTYGDILSQYEEKLGVISVTSAVRRLQGEETKRLY
jgi:hypothetical protein